MFDKINLDENSREYLEELRQNTDEETFNGIIDSLEQIQAKLDGEKISTFPNNGVISVVSDGTITYIGDIDYRGDDIKILTSPDFDAMVYSYYQTDTLEAQEQFDEQLKQEIGENEFAQEVIKTEEKADLKSEIASNVVKTRAEYGDDYSRAYDDTLTKIKEEMNKALDNGASYEDFQQIFDDLKKINYKPSKQNEKEDISSEKELNIDKSPEQPAATDREIELFEQNKKESEMADKTINNIKIGHITTMKDYLEKANANFISQGAKAYANFMYRKEALERATANSKYNAALVSRDKNQKMLEKLEKRYKNSSIKEKINQTIALWKNKPVNTTEHKLSMAQEAKLNMYRERIAEAQKVMDEQYHIYTRSLSKTLQQFKEINTYRKEHGLKEIGSKTYDKVKEEWSNAVKSNSQNKKRNKESNSREER